MGWPATSAADALAALETLEAALLHPHQAAVLWLAWGAQVGDPAFLSIVREMRQAGVAAEQLTQLGLGNKWNSPPRFAGNMAILHVLVGRDWQAAMALAAERPGLAHLGSSHRSADRLAAYERIAQLPIELRELIYAEGGGLQAAASMGTAAAVLGGVPATARALARDLWLRQLPATTPEQQEALQQVSASGMPQQGLLDLAYLVLKQGPDAVVGALSMLRTMLGGWRPAAGAAQSQPAAADCQQCDAARRRQAERRRPGGWCPTGRCGSSTVGRSRSGGGGRHRSSRAGTRGPSAGDGRGWPWAGARNKLILAVCCLCRHVAFCILRSVSKHSSLLYVPHTMP